MVGCLIRPTRRSLERLARLAPDQRAAATAPPGPVLCVAPAGSGKTTTLVARVAWLVDGGADPGTICVVAFNRRAAEELTARLDDALAPLGRRAGLGPRPDVPRARPRAARRGRRLHRPADRPRRAAARAVPGGRRRPTAGASTSRSRGSSWTCGSSADDVAADPAPGPVARAFVAYERAIAELGRRRLRRPRGPGARGCSRTIRPRSPAGGRGARTCSSTRRRTSTGRSWSWRCSSRRPPTTCSWSATTTRRSTAGGSPTCGGCWAWPPRCPGCGASTSRPTTAARGRSSSEPSASSSTTGSGSRSASSPGRGPSGGWCSRRTRPTTSCGSMRAMAQLAGRRLDAGRPRADEPRAARGGGRGDRARHPVPRAGPRRWRSRTRGSTACSSARSAADLAAGRRSRRWSRSGALRAELRAQAAAEDRTPTPAPPRRPTGRRRPTSRPRSSAGRPPLPTSAAPARGDRRAPARLTELRRDDAALSLATAHGTKGLEWDHVARARRRLSRPPVHLGRDRARAGPRGGAAARVRGLDARPPLAHAAVRPGGPVAVPARGVQSPTSWACQPARPPRRLAVSDERPEARRDTENLDADAARRNRTHDRPRLRVPAGRGTLRHSPVREVVQRLRDVADPRRSARRCRIRWKSSGSSTPSPTRAAAATTSSPA